MSDLTRGVAALNDAVPPYDTAGKYYAGTVEEIFVSQRLERVFSKGSKAFYLNYSAIAVTSKLERIKVARVSVANDDAATQALQSLVWDFNDLILQQKRIHETALSLGDSYVIVWPSEDETGVNITFNSPFGCRVMYRADNPLVPDYAIKVWAVGTDVFRANLYYADRIEKYISVTGKSKEDNQWMEYTEEDDGVWPLVNPFGIIPVFHFAANGTPYGTPVHQSTYGAQNAILKLNNLNLATSEYLGFPQRYAITDSGVDSGRDGFDSGDFDSTVVDPASPQTQDSRLKSGPSELQVFKDIKSVGEFGAASPEGYLKDLEFHIDAMATISATPLHAFKAGSDAPSGEALRRAEAPLIKTVTDLTAEFTRPWSKALSFALTVLGLPGRRVDVRWEQPQSVDDKDTWDVVQAKINAGVPSDVALGEAGYLADQIAEWRADAASGDSSIAQAADISAKADALGALIRSGVTPESAAALVGLGALEFTGAVPVTLRLPEAEAAGLEEQ